MIREPRARVVAAVVSLALAHGAVAPVLRAAFPSFAADCAAAVPSGVACASTWDAIACGKDAGVAHLDVARGDVVTNVVVPVADFERVSADGGFCLAPDVPLGELHMAGLWAGWDVRPSHTVVGGVGLFTRVPLAKGACLGRTVRVYSPRYFNDWPIIARINHHDPPAANVDFRAVAHDGMVHLFAFTTRDVAADEELLADYHSERCPRPNFIETGPSWWWQQYYGNGTA